MPKNVEIKARVKDFDKIIDIAKNLCGTEAQILNQEDVFFAAHTGRLKLRNFQDGSPSQLIYYKRPDSENPKISEYSTCCVENPKELSSILKLALGVTGSLRKTRYLFLYGQTRIHIDKVEELGNFVELEVVLTADQGIKEGEEIAHFLMKKLDISEKELIKGAYVDLFLKR